MTRFTTSLKNWKIIKNINKKISFDFDDTLEFQDLQDYAKELIGRGFEVHIVTSRYENTNDYQWKLPKKSENHSDLYLVADKLGILDYNIHFTNMEDKWGFFKDKDFKIDHVYGKGHDKMYEYFVNGRWDMFPSREDVL